MIRDYIRRKLIDRVSRTLVNDPIVGRAVASKVVDRLLETELGDRDTLLALLSTTTSNLPGHVYDDKEELADQASEILWTIFTALGWKWYHETDGIRIPTAGEIHKHLQDLFAEMSDSGDSSISRGRVLVRDEADELVIAIEVGKIYT